MSHFLSHHYPRASHSVLIYSFMRCCREYNIDSKTRSLGKDTRQKVLKSLGKKVIQDTRLFIQRLILSSTCFPGDSCCLFRVTYARQVAVDVQE